MSSVAAGSITKNATDEPFAPSQFSPWCHSRGKRTLDFLMAGALLALALPALLMVAALVRITSSGPTLFRQKRAGRAGIEFELLKFRTMRHDTTGSRITQAGDSRITGVGKWMRARKLDELPQLWNVLRGDMTMVGPRPDLMEFWRRVDAQQRQALQLLPGITGPATIAFRHEEEYLKNIPVEQLPEFYCENLLPRKIRLELEYASSASLLTDIRIMALTALALFIGVD